MTLSVISFLGYLWYPEHGSTKQLSRAADPPKRPRQEDRLAFETERSPRDHAGIGHFTRTVAQWKYHHRQLPLVDFVKMTCCSYLITET